MTDATWVEPELPGMPPHDGADHRPDCYREGDKTIVRASRLGGCTRALIAAGMGLGAEAPPAKIRGAWEESAALEGEVIARGLDWAKEGMKLQTKLLNPSTRTDAAGHPLKAMGGQWGFDVAVGYNTFVRGHVDGVAAVYARHLTESPDVSHVVVEAKAFGDDYYRKWLDGGFESFPEYEAQWDLYRYASGLPGLYVVGHKSKDGKTITEVDVLWDPDPVDVNRITSLLGKARLVAMAVEKGELPETCDARMWPCPFWYLHAEDEELEEIDDDGGFLTLLVENYKTMLDHRKEMEEEIRFTKAKIVEMVGMKKGRVGGYKVNVYASEHPASTREVKAYTSTTVKVEEL